MPYRTHWHARGILWEFYGDVTAQEIEDANQEFYADARSERSTYQIIDVRQVSSLTWSDRDIKVTAAYDLGAESTIKKVKVAFVAVDDDIMAKLEKYADISRRLNSSWQFKGFDTIERASVWAMA